MMPLIGIFAELIFGLLSGVGKLYDLVRSKKKRRVDNSSEDDDGDNNGGCGMRMFGWRKSSSPLNNRRQEIEEEEDMELGGSKVDPAVKEITEEDALAELMRKHHLCGPPRFLFTIVEETVEDLAADERRKSTKLRDLMRADDVASILSPVASPIVKPLGGKSPDCDGDFCAAFRSYSQQRSFKFLRDAEEKLRRKSEEDAGGGGEHVQVQCRSCSSEVLDLRVQVVSG